MNPALVAMTTLMDDENKFCSDQFRKKGNVFVGFSLYVASASVELHIFIGIYMHI